MNETITVPSGPLFPRSLRRAAAAMLLGAMLVAGVDGARACCMVPEGHPSRISQDAQRAILVHRDGREDLTLAISVRLQGEELPDHFAWIVTVPSEPDRYEVVGRESFDAAHMWAAARTEPPPPKSWGLGGRGSPGGVKDAAPTAAALEFGRREVVGPYDILPVRARGVEALDALNVWLKENGFPAESTDHMRYFVERKFTFLAIRVNPAEGATAVPERADLPPLRFSFASERPYYPLKFSSRQGVFELAIVLVTGEPLDHGKSGDALRRLSWNDSRRKRNVTQAPADLAEAVRSSTEAMDPKADWYLNYIHSPAVNEGASIKTWTEDIFLDTDADAPVDALMPSDPRDPSVPEFAPATNGRLVAALAGLLFLACIAGAVVLARRVARSSPEE